MIKGLKNKGMSIMQISKEMGVDRKTVSNWLKRNEPPAYRKRQFRQGKLDPFKDYILERMNEGCVNAAVIFDEIAADGLGITGWRSHPIS